MWAIWVAGRCISAIIFSGFCHCFIFWVDLTPYVKKLAFRLGAVDKPDARKVHHVIMPRLGGLAIYIGFMVAVLTCMNITQRCSWHIIRRYNNFTGGDIR